MKKILLSVSVLVSAQLVAQSYTPALKLVAQKKYTVSNNTKGNMSQEVMGQTMDIPLDVSNNTVLEVKAAGTGSYQLSSTTNHIALSMSMMGQDINYDSDKKEDADSDMGKAFKEQLNKPVAFTVNHFGKVTDVAEKVAAGAKEDVNPVLGIMGMGGAGSATSLALNLFTSDAPLKIGESFTDSSSSETDGKSKNINTYTLSELKDGIAKFTINGTTTLSKAMEMQGMQTVTNTTTKSTGEMLVDVATGLLSKKTVKLNITGTVEVAGMSIPLTGAMDVNIAVSEIK
jgi:DNA uptake protein ComE-like DNA-binding protein